MLCVEQVLAVPVNLDVGRLVRGSLPRPFAVHRSPQPFVVSGGAKKAASSAGARRRRCRQSETVVGSRHRSVWLLGKRKIAGYGRSAAGGRISTTTPSPDKASSRDSPHKLHPAAGMSAMTNVELNLSYALTLPPPRCHPDFAS